MDDDDGFAVGGEGAGQISKWNGWYSGGKMLV